MDSAPIHSPDGVDRLAEAARQLEHAGGVQDAAKIVDLLNAGLNQIGDALLSRVYRDVERLYGADSLLAPISAIQAELETQTQIELYQIAEAAEAIGLCGRVGGDDAWRLDWLAALRLGERAAVDPVRERLAQYGAQSPDQRRLAFSNNLISAMPEASRAPLILFPLFPLAVGIVAATAFGEADRAAELRRAQAGILPAIVDCAECRGRLPEIGAECSHCGNPLWNHEWLTAD